MRVLTFTHFFKNSIITGFKAHIQCVQLQLFEFSELGSGFRQNGMAVGIQVHPGKSRETEIKQI
jgi:hypothetical protein